METSEERHIYQMQYIAWPDHGVPDDSSDFLDFVIRVRQVSSGAEYLHLHHLSKITWRIKSAYCHACVYKMEIACCMNSHYEIV